MVGRRPFGSLEELLTVADEMWRTVSPSDWDEAFAHHPRIGERRAAAAVSAASREWSAGEQSAAAADASAREAMVRANETYERRFGRIYIVCAAGRNAQELLVDIQARLENNAERELAVAAEEQRKITRLRLLALMGAREP
jgi:2-oxo-4-hydroxy-4-carboxy-5-ureidoimidazoline decarboxylase